MIVTNQPMLREFMWERIKEDHGRHSVLMGWARGGRLVACLSFSRFSDSGCEVGIYSEGIIPRKLLEVGFRYTFGQMGFTRLTFCCRSDNLQAISINSALGAELEATLTGTFSDADTLVWRLEPEKCRFWRRLNGKQRPSTGNPGLRQADSDSGRGGPEEPPVHPGSAAGQPGIALRAPELVEDGRA